MLRPLQWHMAKAPLLLWATGLARRLWGWAHHHPLFGNHTPKWEGRGRWQQQLVAATSSSSQLLLPGHLLPSTAQSPCLMSHTLT